MKQLYTELRSITRASKKSRTYVNKAIHSQNMTVVEINLYGLEASFYADSGIYRLDRRSGKSGQPTSDIRGLCDENMLGKNGHVRAEMNR